MFELQHIIPPSIINLSSKNVINDCFQRHAGVIDLNTFHTELMATVFKLPLWMSEPLAAKISRDYSTVHTGQPSKQTIQSSNPQHRIPALSDVTQDTNVFLEASSLLLTAQPVLRFYSACIASRSPAQRLFRSIAAPNSEVIKPDDIRPFFQRLVIFFWFFILCGLL